MITSTGCLMIVVVAGTFIAGRSAFPSIVLAALRSRALMSPGENATPVPEIGTEILQEWRFAECGSVSLSEGVWPNGQTGS
jgi:hypothetical protein